MLKKRIIPCLDIKDGRTVKGINFKNIKDAGDPIALAKHYTKQGADELVFLDITASSEKRKTRAELAKSVSKEINIPFTVGGGINSLRDVNNLLKAGADKVSVNSAAVRSPDMITQMAKEYGSQCVVAAVDTKYVNGQWIVYISGGKKITSLKANNWIKELENLGAGEILLTSMNHDGTKNGFAIELLNQVSDIINIPVIASGGAGNMLHFKEVFTRTKVTGALAASIFHYSEIEIQELKNYLKSNEIAIR